MKIKRGTKITARLLKGLGACRTRSFERVFPAGAKLTKANLVKAATAGLNLNWFAFEVLSATAWAKYNKARVPAWAEYQKATAPALAKYNTPAWAEYEKAVGAAWAKYDKARAPAWAKYDKARALALWQALKEQA